MAKPTASDVKALTGLDIDDAVVTAVIDDASLIADKCAADWSDAQETSIRKWLAAHLLASTHDGGVITSESLGDASESYKRAQVGDGIAGTTYGQQAIALDDTGCLARSGRAKASIGVI